MCGPRTVLPGWLVSSVTVRLSDAWNEECSHLVDLMYKLSYGWGAPQCVQHIAKDDGKHWECGTCIYKAIVQSSCRSCPEFHSGPYTYHHRQFKAMIMQCGWFGMFEVVCIYVCELYLHVIFMICKCLHLEGSNTSAISIDNTRCNVDADST